MTLFELPFAVVFSHFSSKLNLNLLPKRSIDYKVQDLVN